MQFLSEETTQLKREDMSDTAKLLSGMVDHIMMRTNSHEEIKELAKFPQYLLLMVYNYFIHVSC